MKRRLFSHAILYAINGVDGGKEKGGIVCSGGSEGGGEVVYMENDTKFCCSNTIIHNIVQMYSLCFTLQAQDSNFYLLMNYYFVIK